MNLLNEQNPTIDNTTWSAITKTTTSTSQKSSGTKTKQQSNLPVELQTSPTDVSKFQIFVYRTMNDPQILGTAGIDGKWGPKTSAAWDKYGAKYKEMLSNKVEDKKPESNTETQKKELIIKSKEFFTNEIAKGHFNYPSKKFVGIQNFKLPIALQVDSEEIEDKEKKEQGFFRIFPILSGDSGQFFQYNTTGQIIDRGTYTLNDEDVIPGEEILTSGYIREQRWTYASRAEKTKQASDAQKEQDAQRPDKINELKKYLTAVGIFYDEMTGLPHGTVQLDVIYENIMRLMRIGWQSKYFYYFKMVLSLLRELYPTKYIFITEEVIESLKNNVVGQVPENYPGNFNQLADPANKDDVTVWEISPLNKQISQLSRKNDNIYRWRSFSKGLQPNTDYTGEYTFNSSDPNIGNKCWTALKRWYTTYTDGKSPNQEDKKVTQQFLLQCNNGCIFTNADEKGGLFKTKESYQKVDRMIEELRNLRGAEAIYRIPFESVQTTKEKCKSRGKTMRRANMNDSIEKSLRKLVNENLKEAKLRKKRLIKEEKIISNRLSVLFERKLETQKDYNKLFDSLIVESRFLHENGFDENLIKENWFQFLGKLGFGGVADMLQEKFMGWVLEKFGATKGSPTYDLLTIAFGNLELDNIVSILSGNCSALTKLVSKTIVETLITRMGRKVTKTESGGALEGIVRNAIDEYLTKDKDGLIANLEDKLAQFICPSISKVSDKFSGVAANLKNSIMGA